MERWTSRRSCEFGFCNALGDFADDGQDIDEWATVLWTRDRDGDGYHYLRFRSARGESSRGRAFKWFNGDVACACGTVGG